MCNNNMSVGQKMYRLCEKMFPYCRSVTGDGVRRTLYDLQDICSELIIKEVPSGTKVFDWTVPKEWNIKSGWVKDSSGNTVIDFQENNLHILGYSLPVDKYVSLDELKEVVYTQPEQPEVIPYVTSYYKERYGFCMTEKQKKSLSKDTYHIFIDSELKDGYLTYGEIILPGESKEEILLSTYICHPSMANDELSGPSVAIYLAAWLKSLSYRHYTYRIVFIPETIGAITYLSKNFAQMKENTVAGFNIACVGDDRTYSYIASRYGNTLADRVAKNVLHFHYPDYKVYSYLDRGSDERQYNAPGVDLPVCSICRSKHGEYPEYHTSKDNLDLISPAGLAGAFEVYQQCIMALEYNRKYKIQCLCEPQLGKRGLYPTISRYGSYNAVKTMMDFIAYADGNNDLLAISDRIGIPVKELIPVVKKLLGTELIKVVD